MSEVLKFDEQAATALVKLAGQPPAQAQAYIQRMTPAERLAAASCHENGDQLRLNDLLDHVATREHLEADLTAYEATAAAGETPQLAAGDNLADTDLEPTA
jgi:hypothetical protein